MREERGIVGFTGIHIRTNMYHFRHVWVHELVTRSDLRSNGYGKKLLKFSMSGGRRMTVTMWDWSR